MKFILDQQLEKDTVNITRLTLCDLLMSKEAIGPWLILVPRIPAVSEIFELSTAQQQQFLTESSLIAAMLKQVFKADKINIAAIGNKVEQLHIHHVARYHDDPLWPEPIWGNTSGAIRDSGQITLYRDQILHYLANADGSRNSIDSK